MPKLLVYKNLVFFFYSYDVQERYHVHVLNKRKKFTRIAKIWLDTLEVHEKGDLTAKELNEALKLLVQHKTELIAIIEKFKAGKKTKALDINEKGRKKK